MRRDDRAGLAGGRLGALGGPAGVGVIFASLLISGTILRVVEGSSLLSTGLLVAAGVAWLWGITRRLRATCQIPGASTSRDSTCRAVCSRAVRC